MKQSRLVQAVAFGTLLSLSSACAVNQPRDYSNNYNKSRVEQIQDKDQEQKEKSKTRKFIEGTAYLTIQLLATAQYFI
ncbi:MAG: hypothetical protein AAB866_01480 [Patescibacteria group bacterium]